MTVKVIELIMEGIKKDMSSKSQKRAKRLKRAKNKAKKEES